MIRPGGADWATTLWAAQDAWRVSHGSSAALAARQADRFQRLLTWARARSPFYARLYRGLPAGPLGLEALPPVTKHRLMAEFDRWATQPGLTLAAAQEFMADPARLGQRFFGQATLWRSTGVTGDPSIVAHDRRAVAIYRGLTLARGWLPWFDRRRLGRLLVEGDRVAVVTATAYTASASLAALAAGRRGRALHQVRGFSVFSPLPALVAALNAFRPAELVGYPNALVQLAAEQRAGRLRIAPLLIGSGGEWLTPLARRIIGSTFGCPLRENYGASEFTRAAWECRRGRLHVSADWVLLEPVDEHYRPLPAGQPSHTTLLTNLANRLQPLLRYDLGDSLSLLPDRCGCGSPLPTIRLEGRRDETLELRDRDGATTRVSTRVVCALVERANGLQEYQVRQTGPSSLTVRLCAAAGVERSNVFASVRDHLQGHLAELGLRGVHVELDPTAPSRDSTSDKFRVVWAELPPAEQAVSAGPVPT